jgi:predicted aspartyl protease
VKLHGVIVERSPVIAGEVRQGVLYLKTRGPVSLVVDTGFTGAFSVPDEIARSLDLDFVGLDTFSLATGQAVELPVYLGVVRIGGRSVDTWFILGEALVGMEFLEETCSGLQMDLDQKTITLLPRNRRERRRDTGSSRS